MEVGKLDNTSAGSVILLWKSIFARHGVPEQVVTDNCPQFDSYEFRKFARDYQFRHIISSPYYPRGNGEAERGVKTVKELLRKSDEPYLALLAYRSTPVTNGYSPAELLMKRILRTNVRISREARVSDKNLLLEREEELRRKQKYNFNR